MSLSGTYSHIPIMVEEVLSYMPVYSGGVYIDATSGMGGHSAEIAAILNNTGLLICMDKDSILLEHTMSRLNPYDNILYYHKDYRHIKEIVEENEVENNIMGILFDLGACSYHFDNPERGFSFKFDTELDMRYNSETGITAKDIVNQFNVYDLEHLIKRFGEERYAKKIAKRIVEQRKRETIRTTKQLADIIIDIYPKKHFDKKRIHPATRTFQALRIAVNDELTHLKDTLVYSAITLKKGGRLAVISFHSLEDRITKKTFQFIEKRKSSSQPHFKGSALKVQDNSRQASLHGISQFNSKLEGLPDDCARHNAGKAFNIITKKPLTPSKLEIANNARSRSAKLRILERTE